MPRQATVDEVQAPEKLNSGVDLEGRARTAAGSAEEYYASLLHQQRADAAAAAAVGDPREFPPLLHRDPRLLTGGSIYGAGSSLPHLHGLPSASSLLLGGGSSSMLPPSLGAAPLGGLTPQEAAHLAYLRGGGGAGTAGSLYSPGQLPGAPSSSTAATFAQLAMMHAEEDDLDLLIALRQRRQQQQIMAAAAEAEQHFAARNMLLGASRLTDPTTSLAVCSMTDPPPPPPPPPGPLVGAASPPVYPLSLQERELHRERLMALEGIPRQVSDSKRTVAERGADAASLQQEEEEEARAPKKAKKGKGNNGDDDSSDKYSTKLSKSDDKPANDKAEKNDEEKTNKYSIEDSASTVHASERATSSRFPQRSLEEERLLQEERALQEERLRRQQITILHHQQQQAAASGAGAGGLADYYGNFYMPSASTILPRHRQLEQEGHLSALASSGPLPRSLALQHQHPALNASALSRSYLVSAGSGPLRGGGGLPTGIHGATPSLQRFLTQPSGGPRPTLPGQHVPSMGMGTRPIGHVDDETKTGESYPRSTSDRSSSRNGESRTPGKKDSRRRRTYRHESFPQKLYRLLMEVEEQGKSDIVSFVDDGKAFRVHKESEFEEHILPVYFRHKNIASFQRQLRGYKFIRIVEPPFLGGYRHVLFVKGRPEQCKDILSY